MPSTWRIKRIGSRYYLYHRDKYIGPVDDIVRVYEEYGQAPGVGQEPGAGGIPSGLTVWCLQDFTGALVEVGLEFRALPLSFEYCPSSG